MCIILCFYWKRKIIINDCLRNIIRIDLVSMESIYIYMYNEECTCVIYYKVFADEINQNKLDVNMLKTFVIDLLYNRFLFFYIRFIHRKIIIRKILHDIQQENQFMEMNPLIMLVSKNEKKIFSFFFLLF
jgi:hypothetical protein